MTSNGLSHTIKTSEYQNGTCAKSLIDWRVPGFQQQGRASNVHMEMGGPVAEQIEAYIVSFCSLYLWICLIFKTILLALTFRYELQYCTTGAVVLPLLLESIMACLLCKVILLRHAVKYFCSFSNTFAWSQNLWTSFVWTLVQICIFGKLTKEVLIA